MGIVRRAASAISKRRKKRKDECEAVEDSVLTRRQSWRRPPGGVKESWKTLDTGYFTDGSQFDRTRLEAWLQRRYTSRLTNAGRWVWMKLDANGFRVACRSASSGSYRSTCAARLSTGRGRRLWKIRQAEHRACHPTRPRRDRAAPDSPGGLLPTRPGP